MDKRQEERDQYIENMLDRLFFQNWTNGTQRWRNLELIVTPECNLKCTYCYINRHGDELYKEDIRDSSKIVHNAELVLDWVIENGYNVNKIDIFSGSLFSQQIGWDVLDVIYNKYKDAPADVRPNMVVVPTNYTFLLDEDITDRVEELIARFKRIGMNIFLSGSVEGKYMEQNRRFRHDLEMGSGCGEHLFLPESNEPRDDEYYDKVMKFTKKHNFGLHPMIYSKDIELWEKNFKWFQEKFKEHGLKHNNIFLLEVRNYEWTKEQTNDFYKFVKYVHEWVLEEVCDGDPELFVELIKNRGTINLISTPLSKNTNTGIVCSIQTALMVRLGDLHLVPCHRTSYDGLEYGKLKVKDGKIAGIKGLNIELATQIYSFNHQESPMCTTCPINAVCNQTCLGANLESTGSLFTPPPTVCRLHFAKARAITEFMLENDLFDNLMNTTNQNQVGAYVRIRKMIEGEEDGAK